MEELQFDLPKRESSYIKVIGVGGGGGNAVKNMYREGITGVDFIICNTDAQALANNPVSVKVQLGMGLGAGNHPEVARAEIEKKRSEIKQLLENNTRMLFIAAGMGGGTGTGAAPVVAEIAKEIELEDDIKKILTVAIVTTPFSFEGRKRREQAAEGLKNLRKNVDAIIVLNSDKLLDYDKTLDVLGGFALMDKVICTAAKGISEIITKDSYINVDFKDVNTVMRESGVALMGYGMASGENRARLAIEEALDAPLLNDNSIRGAKNVLFHVSFSTKNPLKIEELRIITDIITEHTGVDSADIIWGGGEDESVNDNLVITLIATGFDEKTFDKGRTVVGINGEDIERPSSGLSSANSSPKPKVFLTLDDDVVAQPTVSKIFEAQAMPATTEVPAQVKPVAEDEEMPAFIVEMAAAIPTRVDMPVAANIPTRVDMPVAANIPTRVDMPVAANIPTRVDMPVDTAIVDMTAPAAIPTRVDVPVAANIPTRVDVAATVKDRNIPTKSDMGQTLNAVVEERMRRMRALKEQMASSVGFEQIAKEPAYSR
ncbi:MAG: cell division protein FtsZ, partial [Bacteroidales bacterium]|nr:cell division protein FtsZ [Bacteroidales bacterium]